MVRLLNRDHFSNNLITDDECSFPKTRNNYKGEVVEAFHIPVGMPAPTPFEDMTVTPSPCLVLKTKGVVNQMKVFINLVHHSEVPKFSEVIDTPYLLIGNQTILPVENEGEGGLIYDIALNSSIWEAAEAGNIELMKQLSDS